MKNKSKSSSVRRMTVIGMLGSISAVLGMTPLGFIPIGPTRATIMHIPVIIGAILEGPIVGAMVGLIFGIFSMIQAVTNPTPISFVFLNPLVSILPRVLVGIASYYSYVLFKRLGKKTSMIAVMAIWALSLVFLANTFITQINQYKLGEITILKVILMGVLIIFTLVVGIVLYKRLKEQAIEVMASAAIGTITNTVGVLAMIYFIYAEKFVDKIGGNTELAGEIILGIGIANGIPEIIVAIVIVSSVVMALKKR